MQKKVEEEILKTLSLNDDGSAAKFSKAAKTAVQFLADWKQLKTPAARRGYLRLLRNPSKDYAVVFKQSMEAAIFTDIVELLESDDFSDNVELSGHLVGLARVPRISALAMFLAADEKTKLRCLVERVFSQNPGLPQPDKAVIEKAFC
jgi:hypothetical protein